VWKHILTDTCSVLENAINSGLVHAETKECKRPGGGQILSVLQFSGIMQHIFRTGRMSARLQTALVTITSFFSCSNPHYNPSTSATFRTSTICKADEQFCASCHYRFATGNVSAQSVDGSFEDSATRILSTVTSSICSLDQAQRPAKVIPLVLQCLSESQDDFASICGRHHL